MSLWLLAFLSSCGPLSRAKSPSSGSSAALCSIGPKASANEARLGLHRLKGANDLGDALAGNVLEGAGFIDLGHGIHQGVLADRFDGCGGTLYRLGGIHDVVGGAGGLGDDLFQLVRSGGKHLCIPAVVRNAPISSRVLRI